MKIIPLIHLKKRKIVDSKHTAGHSIIKNIEPFKNKKLYILDHDGLEKNRPNLCIYQKLSKYHEIWIDAGPQVIGDVVDSVIAGATAITIRQNIWRDVNTYDVKEITENKIYTEINQNNYNISRIKSSLIYSFDGLILFDKKNQIECDFKYAQYLKNITMKYETYAYEINKTNALYWKKLGLKGLLTEIENIEEFENIDF
jgi:hypothetical protein